MTREVTLQVLHETDDLSRSDLPDMLQRGYGGPLVLTEPSLVANFVATIDGVVAIPSIENSNEVISAGSEGDRFLMGLLRASADVVLIGSGTLHGSPHGRWTAERAYPPASGAFAELRRRRGQPPRPQLAVMTASGRIDVDHPAVVAGAIVLTTDHGRAALQGKLPAASSIHVLPGSDAVSPAAAVGALRGAGHQIILSEAGPRVFGSLLAEGLVDELFLTQSPLLAGRQPGNRRLGLVEDAVLLPESREQTRLLSVRRHADHLFLRYALGGRAAA